MLDFMANPGWGRCNFLHIMSNRVLLPAAAEFGARGAAVLLLHLAYAGEIRA
jgi:hypothetical protein